MMKVQGKCGTIGALLLGIAVSSSALAQANAANSNPQNPAQQVEDDREMALELCRNILRSVGELPENASVTDLEAAIVFAISQASLPADEARRDRIVEIALDCVVGDGTRRNLVLAVENVRNSYGIGTGAILPGGSGANNGGFGGSFSPPLVGIGGGSTNYSSGQ